MHFPTFLAWLDPKRLTTLWADVGIDPDMAEPLARRVRLNNRLCVADALTGVVVLPLAYANGVTGFPLGLALLAYCALLIGPLLSASGLHTLARIVPGVFASGTVALFVFMLGREAHIELLLLNTLAARYLVFGPKEPGRLAALAVPALTFMGLLVFQAFPDLYDNIGAIHRVNGTPEVDRLRISYFWYLIIAFDVAWQLYNRGSFLASEADHSVDSIRTARDEAVAATQAKSRFLATMSHELRTPAAGVIGLLDLVDRSGLDEEQQQNLDDAGLCAEYLLGLVEDLLDVSRMEAQSLQLLPTPTNVHDVARQAIHLVESSAAHKGLLTQLDVRVSHPWRIVDARRLRQILLNLLTNAVKFSHRGTICLTVDDTPGGLVFKIVDEGIGISHDDLQRIFDFFVQADSELSRSYGGLGLGLTIARSLTAAMGGRLEVTSEVDLGSCFSVYLPLQVVEAPAPPPPPDTPSNDQRQLHVMLVDDNPVNLKVMGAYLQQLGHQVITATDGVDAVDAARNHDFDVILMDLLLPRMDGMEATRTIRGWKGPKGRVPIIAITASVHSSEFGAAHRAGMNQLLTKPVRKEDIDKAIKGVLQSGVPEPSLARA